MIQVAIISSNSHDLESDVNAWLRNHDDYDITIEQISFFLSEGKACIVYDSGGRRDETYYS